MTSPSPIPKRVLTPVPAADPDDPDADVRRAQETGRQATEEARAAVSKRAQQVVVAVIIALVALGGANAVATYLTSQHAVAEAVDIAEAKRLNGAAQGQAAQAASDAAAANAILTARGLPAVTIPGAGQGPPSDTINASAAAWALTYVPADRVLAGDLRVIAPALDRYFASFPAITASGPIRNRVGGTMLLYIELTAAGVDGGR